MEPLDPGPEGVAEAIQYRARRIAEEEIAKLIEQRIRPAEERVARLEAEVAELTGGVDRPA